MQIGLVRSVIGILGSARTTPPWRSGTRDTESQGTLSLSNDKGRGGGLQTGREIVEKLGHS